MATPSKPVNNLSANSKNVQNFRSRQRFRVVYIVLIIGMPFLIGFVAYGEYKRAVSPVNSLNEAPQEAFTDDGSISNQVPSSPPSSSSPSTESPQTPTNSGSSNETSKKETVTKIPDGVIVAINSIEANGIKNNQYVDIDTTSVPEGTVVRINRESWTQPTPNQVVVNGTVSAYGQSRQGTLTFGKVNGTWKVINYTVAS